MEYRKIPVVIYVTIGMKWVNASNVKNVKPFDDKYFVCIQ